MADAMKAAGSDDVHHWTFMDGVPVDDELRNVDISDIRAICNEQSRTQWTSIASRGRLYQFIALSDKETQVQMRSKAVSCTALNNLSTSAKGVAFVEDEPKFPTLTSKSRRPKRKRSIDDTLSFFDGQNIHEIFHQYSIANLKKVCEKFISVSGVTTRTGMYIVIGQATAPIQEQIRQSIINPVQKGEEMLGCVGTLGEVHERHNHRTSGAIVEVLERRDDDQLHRTTEGLCENSFMKIPSKLVVDTAITEFIDRTSNAALAIGVCAGHPHHEMLNGVTDDGRGDVCMECFRALKSNKVPMFALANGLWIGRVPHELAYLTLPERILIAKYFPAAYIIKLFPKKKKGAHHWDRRQMYSGLRGNVSTYRLDQAQIMSMIDGTVMPQVVKVLAATIGITFVGPKNIPEKCLPDMFRVRRTRVKKALEWLKENNPLFKDIIISAARLAQLPEDDVPYELLVTAKHSMDVNMLYAEQEGYVPVQDASDEEDEDAHSESDDDDMGIPTEPAVLPLSHLGVVDIDGTDVSESELMAHALANCCQVSHEEDYMIRRGSAFVNEYARTDPSTGQRNDGGPSDANHLLGTFPTLFPFGQGGFEIERSVNVPYEAHVRWALRYEDRRFRKDVHFPFQVFGVCQKRQNLLGTITADDLTNASREETRGVPFSNPAVRTLRSQLSGVKTKVQGSDESRISIRSKIWGTNLLHNPPSLWVTINPSDTQDPIAQVMAGMEIDLDAFCKTAGPDSVDRALNMAADPYASANFFHMMIKIILEVLIGVSKRRNGVIVRKEGIFGIVKSYVGTVEAQGRGSLHLHLPLWLAGAPTAWELKHALSNNTFREKIKKYIKQTIRADVEMKDTPEILAMKKVEAVSYSRPLDPQKMADVDAMKSTELELARATQFHQCSFANCLKIVKGRTLCKRRAPFALADDDWVDSKGGWGPKRLCGFLNNWNPPLLMTIQANHDVKLIMNGGETSVLTWYITNYASKKQQRSSNVSALLAKRVAFHLEEEKRRSDVTDVNKRLIQRCANTLTRDREFSAPEIMSYLMGWGDRFESHHYVAIYSDAIITAVKEKYPGLGSRTISQTHRGHGPEMPGRNEGQTVADMENHNHIITMVSGVITLRDQLHEYMYRGEEMTEMNLLSFVLDTYDTKSETGDGIRGGLEEALSIGSRTCGRSPNRRVPYRPGFNRQGRCRVFRTDGHETLPHFVGAWPPRNDRPKDKELYCAMILTLLKPWLDLSDLKTDIESFEETFDCFVAGASKETEDIIANIQYYYECYDSAKKRQEVRSEDVDRTMDYEIEAGADDLTSDSLVSHPEGMEVSEEDIELAYEGRGMMRERLYAEIALNIAMECGVFSEVKPDTVFLPSAEKAETEDLTMFEAWGEQLKMASRREAEGNGPSLFANVDGAAPTAFIMNESVEGVQRANVEIDSGDVPDKKTRLAVASLKDDMTKNLKGRVELSVGMKAMVVLNIATDADVANGTRGTVEGFVLDPREDYTTPDEDGCLHLRYPPPVIYFKPDMETQITFEGVPKGIIPILPSMVGFTVEVDGQRVKLERRQIAIVPGYAFTDYKAQGQTMGCVIVDIAKPPSGRLSPFSVYVALSRSKGRKTIRILRDFDPTLFMHHPSEDLRADMARLERLNEQLKTGGRVRD
ncbi:hypothetical protein BYT27DRAFT_7272529 [Phlegmacium glaucopus]|nr:hypothetical protein BYT27DRAFT_7272529 [Phlegmacium glaucopus]